MSEREREYIKVIREFKGREARWIDRYRETDKKRGEVIKKPTERQTDKRRQKE